MEKLSLPTKGPGVLEQASGGSKVAPPQTTGTSSNPPPRGAGEIQERHRKTWFSTDATVKEFAKILGQNPDPQRLPQSSPLADLRQLETSPKEVQVLGGTACRRRRALKRAKNQHGKSVHSVQTKDDSAAAASSKRGATPPRGCRPLRGQAKSGTKVKDIAEVLGQHPDLKRLLRSSTLADLFRQLEKSSTKALCVRFR